jgi:alanyl-tRNA synthetase
MRSADIRRLFLDFFVARGHREVPSSSLEPKDDPTLLFTNAGMVQFKRVFLGQERRDYARATTCQKVVRAGGKHNDLEQVGHTKRHHTFFEMLGNFSFGDYFKRDAIAFAWEFVTGQDGLGISPDRLRVTVHHSDQEARALWRELAGLPEHRIYGLGDKDNFWQMGDTGPCGPCTEIYVDVEWTGGQADRRTEEVVPQEEFERLAEEGRFLEIWNLVFMQFDRAPDGTLTPLPRPSVDTGAGLERIAAVMQGQDDNFHTDLFRPLLDRIGELVGTPYDYGHDQDPDEAVRARRGSYRVLADHARAVSFLLADGIYPSNEGRGYVLRRILRRAVRHAWLLGRRESTLAPLTDVVVREMGPAYPELVAKATYIHDTTRAEEERFLETIDGGLKRLEEIFATGAGTIAGEEAFKLYDTYGFPIDLTEIIAGERGVSVDLPGFERALAEQRERSRAARREATAVGVDVALAGDYANAVSAERKGTPPGKSSRGSAVHLKDPTAWRTLKRGKQKFVGYETTRTDSDLLAFRQAGDRVELLLRENPFYAESGGQVSDTGSVAGTGWSLEVDSVRKDPAKGTVIGGSFDESFDPTPVEAMVDTPRRRNIERNHSATHLVHLALRRHLGAHARQAGSLVEPERLRFDFTHQGPIEPETLRAIERDVNEQIWANYETTTRHMAYRDALDLGAMAFFSDKYGDVVRVVQMGDSIELCGGTHVRSTGQVGLFRFTGQGGVQAGVRRIEAVTGPIAYQLLQELDDRIAKAAERLKSQPEHLARKIDQLLEERQRLEARLQEARRSGGSGPAEAETVQVDHVQLTMAETATDDRNELGQIADRFREGRRNAVLVLFGTAGRGAIHVTLSEDLVSAGRKAGDLVNRIAAISGGKGGGGPHFASAGAGDPARLADARAQTPQVVAAWLGNGG